MSIPFPEPTSPLASRAEVFLTYLDYFRATLVSKLEGLPGGELSRSRLPSGWTPLQLLKHLTFVEMRWLEWGFEGQSVTSPWGDSRDGRWHVGPGETFGDLAAALRARAARTRAIVTGHDLAEIGQPGERWDGAEPASLERVLFHLLQEYARHVGHLDIVSELAGGPTGKLPAATGTADLVGHGWPKIAPVCHGVVYMPVIAAKYANGEQPSKRGIRGSAGTGRIRGELAVLTVHNFTYGFLTPGLAFLMSCMGAFLGLRCTTRGRSFQGGARVRWLLLGGVSIGATGIWTMHFIAMLGFTIPGQTIRYNVPVTILSLLVAVVIVCVGLLIAGFGELTLGPLLLGGLVTGIGVAVMHYMGMAAMRMDGRVTYNAGLFIVSVVIAIVAATAALWAALRLNGVGPTLGASVIMGIAVSGMHYTGMAAMRMFVSSGPAGMVMGVGGGATAESFLLPLIIGIAVITFVMTATITLSPTAEEIHYDEALLRHLESISGSHAVYGGGPAPAGESMGILGPLGPSGQEFSHGPGIVPGPGMTGVRDPAEP